MGSADGAAAVAAAVGKKGAKNGDGNGGERTSLSQIHRALCDSRGVRMLSTCVGKACVCASRSSLCATG